MSNHVCGCGLWGVLDMVMTAVASRGHRNVVLHGRRRAARRTLVAGLVRARIVR
jgi:hypothetical protein